MFRVYRTPYERGKERKREREKMASASRSALMSGLRTIASQTTVISRTLAQKHVPISPFSSSTRTLPRAASRQMLYRLHIQKHTATRTTINPISKFYEIDLNFVVLFFRIVGALGMVESMMPLHSAIASARLKSSLAVDSACWSWLSQGTSRSCFMR